ncbi:MAG: bifunctional UDP-2,4-diacetamido-2,4,6-trideoxy-beta-L-altropyranose hydrolase/GNAT family N-acetyltransferase [Chthoniobacterales bacterium]
MLIAFGGTDVAGLAQKTLNYLRTNPPDNFIVRLLKPDAAFGESFKNVKLQSPDWNIAPHLKWADAILCTPSTIALEAACTGIPVFTVTVASNQQGIAFAMEKNRSGESFGTAKDYDPSRVFAAFKKRFQNHPALTRIGENGRQWIDGRGAERIVAALTAVNFQFRAAESSDSELVWHWANDPAVRRASYDSKDIPWKTHQEWYKRKLHSNDDTILITETIDGKPFAVCRFERRDSICTISFSLDSAYRGMGLGRLVLSKACKTYCTAHPKTSIEAQIKIDNLASISTFELAGFRKTQKTGDRLTFCYAA